MQQTVNTAHRINLLRKYPVFIFILLTFLISHILNPIAVELAHIFIPEFSFSFPLSGLNESSLLAQYGGTIAAIFVVVKLLYGIKGFKSTLHYSRLNAGHVVWLLVSVFMPLLIILASYVLGGVGIGNLLNILVTNWRLYLLVIGGFILSAGLAEEYGWRGFLLPQLLKSKSPLTATFIVFIVLSVWHFPALIGGWKGEPLVLWLILSFPVAVIHSWLFFKSKGNLIVTILFHACFDAQYSFFSNFISEADINHPILHQGWAFIALNCAVCLVIILATKGRLGYDAQEFSVQEYFGEKK